MRICLLWRSLGEGDEILAPDAVAANLEELFAPLFAVPLQTRWLRNASVCLAFLELPVDGWKPPFFQEDAETWALAVDYPTNAHTILGAKGSRLNDAQNLLALCGRLEEEPHSLLRELAPPFSLVWSSKQTDQTFVQNDALGQAQLFQYQRGGLWALSNKIAAFKALGVQLEWDREEWAVRVSLGWFPMDTTGFKNIRYIGPGTQLRLGSRGLERKTYDVLSEWVHPAGLSQENCLELARASLMGQIEAIRSLCSNPSVGLSGGWDSRAVVACLRAANLDFSARVRGLPTRPDVVIATRLAKVAGLDLRVKTSSGLPPENFEACKSCISLALLWQAGAMVISKHKTFLSKSKRLDGGVVNMMGQHGEIGRAFYASRIKAWECTDEQYDERLLRWLLWRIPPFLREAYRDTVRDYVAEAIRQSDRFGLTGLSRLDFFYLYERTRRWASGSLNSTTGVVIAPFLNPDYIRATFGYGLRTNTNPFHRYILAAHAPEWLHIPFSEELRKEAMLPAERASPPKDWRRPLGQKNYDSALYWRSVGRPIIEKALAQDGPWTEIFDPEAAKTHWSRYPDELAIVSLLPDSLLFRAGTDVEHKRG